MPTDQSDQFALVPRRHPALRVSGDTLELPRRLGWLPARRFRLDGLSLMLWQRIDGRRTLGELVEGLVADEQLGFHEARLLTLQLLRVLARRGVVIASHSTALPRGVGGSGLGA